ncbi:hypothetical protein [Nonomuraea sp. NPDC049709]|uniref:hypothetical protein n=1 Tax=Nonomuraea sp. NPDC049709 TaxID=3154736 RepID=UPI00341D4D0A
MARFKNISGTDVHVGRTDGRVVEAGKVIAVDGEVTEQTDEAYIVGAGDDARAWPRATWELVSEPKSSVKAGGE